MIILKSSIIVTLFLISNINPFKFPDYLNKSKTQSKTRTTTESSTETTTTTNSPIEITTSTDSSSETTTANDNLAENETESNNEPFCGDLVIGDYCADPAGYPEENILKAVVSQQEILSSFFDVPPIVGFNGFNNSDYKEYYDYKEEEEFENVCRTETDHIMPRAAKNTKGEFQFIVNRPKGDDSFVQKVQVSKCVNPGNECGDGDGGVLNAKTECHQEYLEHKLVAVTKDGAQVVVDTFKFPSCCTCRISRNK